MEATQVTEVISKIHFMPTWEFDSMTMDADLVMVRAVWDTVNSDQDQARLGYPQGVSLERALMVHPQDYATENDLHAALITWLIEIMIHESREFFRVGDEMAAPFHPHRYEGESLWSQYVTRAETDPMRGAIPLGL
jgi:metal-sulfur cluster biosynthetic enzyme